MKIGKPHTHTQRSNDTQISYKEKETHQMVKIEETAINDMKW